MSLSLNAINNIIATGEPNYNQIPTNEESYISSIQDEEQAASESVEDYGTLSFDDLTESDVNAIDIYETRDLPTPVPLSASQSGQTDSDDNEIDPSVEEIEKNQENQFLNLFAQKHFGVSYGELSDAQKDQIRKAIYPYLTIEGKINPEELKKIQALTTEQVTTAEYSDYKPEQQPIEGTKAISVYSDYKPEQQPIEGTKAISVPEIFGKLGDNRFLEQEPVKNIINFTKNTLQPIFGKLTNFIEGIGQRFNIFG